MYTLMLILIGAKSLQYVHTGLHHVKTYSCIRKAHLQGSRMGFLLYINLHFFAVVGIASVS